MKKIWCLAVITCFFYSYSFAALTPSCDCVEKIDATHYKAWFGYSNTETSTITKTIGTDNKITGGGLTGDDQGQLRVFEVGSFTKLFSIIFDGTSLSWVLNGNTATASFSSSLCEFSQGPSTFEPNYTRTTSYNDDGNPPQVVTEYSDGIGRSLQVQADLHGIGGYDALVTATEYDDAGRQYKSYKTFPSITDKQYLSLSQIDKNANEYFSSTGKGPDAEGYPFSEVVFYSDPLNRKQAVGAEGKEFSLDQTDGHPVMYWYFSTKANSGLTDRDADGFLTSATLAKLVGTSPVLPSEVTAPTHFLSVTRDADGNFTQQLTNPLHGKTEASWAAGSSTVTIKSKSVYDAFGNLKEEIPPGTKLISSTKYTYNTLGQLITKDNPDGAVEYYTYDNAGNLETVQYKTHDTNAKLLREIKYKYDEFNRTEEVVLMSGKDEIPKVIYAYDRFENIPVEYIRQLSGELGNLNNLKGRIAAVISFGEMGDYKTVTARNRVIELFSYDKEGRIENKYVNIPSIYSQRIAYEYDLQGKVIKESIITAGYEPVIKKYKYDELGRLCKVIHANAVPPKILASYRYDDRGLLKYKQLYTNAGHTDNYTYDLHDFVKSITSPIGGQFSETLDYSSNYTGNISGASYNYNTSPSNSFDYSYTYDGINRLTSVKSGTSTKTEICKYDYDAAGRFLNKKENSSDLKDYGYYPESSSSSNIYTSRLRKTGTSGNRFIYDEFGNLLVDKTKKLVIQYDYRNLPVFFRFYSSIPSGIGSDTRGSIYITDSEYSGDKGDVEKYMDYIKTKTKGTSSEVKMTGIAVMLYDASGNRVMKTSGN